MFEPNPAKLGCPVNPPDVKPDEVGKELAGGAPNDSPLCCCGAVDTAGLAPKLKPKGEAVAPAAVDGAVDELMPVALPCCVVPTPELPKENPPESDAVVLGAPKLNSPGALVDTAAVLGVPKLNKPELLVGGAAVENGVVLSAKPCAIIPLVAGLAKVLSSFD